jgi:integrase
VPTVREVLTRHLDVVMPQRNRALLTIRSYRSLCEQQVYPRWGGQRIDRLSARDIEDGLAAMRRDGLAASTRRKVLAILSSVLEIETRRGTIARNPCALVVGPRLGKPDKTGLTSLQGRTVLAAVAGRRNGARWSVGLALGLRQGEALGLRWQYVDLERGQLRAWYQLQRLPWRHGCDDPAACCAGRHPPLPEALPQGCPQVRPPSCVHPA